MNVGFHFYIIYLLCIGLGMDYKTSMIIAYASQHIDDNIFWETIDKGLPTEFPVVATFSIDVTKSKDDKEPTLLIHFPPGDGQEIKGVARKDGKWFEGITTPNCSMAEIALDRALLTKNPYLIGVALHTYADTWAHQGFAACVHDCNESPNSYGKYAILTKLGHARVGHYPDWPVIWRDDRLLSGCRINNKHRFKQAARCIAKKLDKYINPNSSYEESKSRRDRVVNSIFKAFGEPIPCKARSEKELEILSEDQFLNFRRLGLEKEFGGEFIEVYDVNRWERNAVKIIEKGGNNQAIAKMTKGIFTGFLEDKKYWLPTFYNNILKEDNKDHSKDFLMADLVNNKVKYFKEFNFGDISDFSLPIVNDKSETWTDVIHDTSELHYFKFHVAAQIHLSHLICETQKIKVNDDFISSTTTSTSSSYDIERSDKTLYSYYDEGKEEIWVSEMKERTSKIRNRIY